MIVRVIVLLFPVLIPVELQAEKPEPERPIVPDMLSVCNIKAL